MPTNIINQKIARPPKKLIDQFRRLPTSILSDTMNRMNSMKAEVKPITGLKNPMVGPALTVNSFVGDNLIIHRAIYLAEPGDILVIDAKDYKDISVWGAIMTQAALLQGIKGVVINGSIRDLEENKRMKLPIFCLGVVPAGSQKNWEGDINIPIQCGGVQVNPGDIIAGDADGVVVVPSSRAIQLLRHAKEKAEAEKIWISQIKRGKSTLEAIGLKNQRWKVEDKQQAIERYEARFQEYGISPQTMGWKDKKQQYMRFAILSEVGDLNEHSILDIGCGFGDLYDFLKKSHKLVEYTGYDISGKFIEIAKKRHPESTFEIRDILEATPNRKFDYIVSSGILNHKVDDNESFMREMVKKAFKFCNIGIAFNMMSDYVDYQEKFLYYYNPEEIFAFCKDLTRRVILRHDYMPYEFTVYLYKQEDIDERNIFIEAFRGREDIG